MSFTTSRCQETYYLPPSVFKIGFLFSVISLLFLVLSHSVYQLIKLIGELGIIVEESESGEDLRECLSVGTSGQVKDV